MLFNCYHGKSIFRFSEGRYTTQENGMYETKDPEFIKWFKENTNFFECKKDGSRIKLKDKK